jgi:divalent metal cation (Fe/Co/Zn/Cd) transporter
LHVQVDPDLPLEKANEIAESVESAIQKSVPQIRQVTVHLEPSMPERASGRIVDDRDISDTIMSIVKSYPEVLAVDSIITYSTSNVLHINITCLLAGKESIKRIHDMTTKVEEGIKQRLGDVIVTIRPEPISAQNQRSESAR